MDRGHGLARSLLAGVLLFPLVMITGGLAQPRATTASTVSAAAKPTPTPRPRPTAGASGSGSTDLGSTSSGPADLSGLDSSLLQDQLGLLDSNGSGLSTSVPLSTLPPITGSVAGLEGELIGTLSRLQASSLPGSVKGSLLSQLSALNLQLGPALDLQDQISTLRNEENVLVQARVDAQAAIDKVAAQVQVSLDRLRLAVQTEVSADVVASVGSLTVTVTGGADTIQAQLGAQVNRLLVNVLADLDVLHIATLHATANVDTARLNVTLFALVKKLRLDLSLLITSLSVTVHADLAATVTAELSLTASLSAELDGLRADVAANVDTKLGGLDALLSSLIGTLNGTLASVTAGLARVGAQVR